MKIKLISTLSLALFLIVSLAGQVQAKIMKCERYSAQGSEYLSGGMHSFDKAYPKVIYFNETDLRQFAKVKDKTYVRYEYDVKMGTHQNKLKVYFTLFENKKLTQVHPIETTIRAAWKCDLAASEVIAFQNAQQINAASTGQSKTIADVISKLNDEEICKASKQGYSAHKKEALRRGLDCATPTSAQKDNNNVTSSTTMSLQEAKTECASLGFTAGTEKHGDCVMRLID